MGLEVEHRNGLLKGLTSYAQRSLRTVWGYSSNSGLRCSSATDKLSISSWFYLQLEAISCWVQWVDRGTNTAMVRIIIFPGASTIIHYFLFQWEFFCTIMGIWTLGVFLSQQAGVTRDILQFMVSGKKQMFSDVAHETHPQWWNR